MIIEKNADPIDVRAGVYLHYKGELYLVEGYSQNDSDDHRLQIAYIPLYTDATHTGARKITRDWQEFFETVCPFHDGVNAYGDAHNIMIEEQGTCDPDNFLERFEYKGPIYYRGM